MPSTTVSCPVGVWTKINIVSTQGVIAYVTGEALLTQQSVDPNTLTGRIACCGSISRSETERIYDTSNELTEFIWAKATEKGTVIDVTPVGGIL